ncbi:MAG: hypothetical protein WBA28_09210, partial [Microbacteriaceae bacterium]
MSFSNDLFGALHDAQAEAYNKPNKRIILTSGDRVVHGILFTEVEDFWFVYVQGDDPIKPFG